MRNNLTENKCFVPKISETVIGASQRNPLHFPCAFYFYAKKKRNAFLSKVCFKRKILRGQDKKFSFINSDMALIAVDAVSRF